MLLPLCNHQPPSLPPPKTLLNPSPNSFFFFFPSSFPSTHLTQNPKNPPKSSLMRTSAVNTKTLPQSAIQRIADKLRSLGYADDDNEDLKETLISNSNHTSPGEIFVPLPTHLPKHRVGHTIDSSWSTPENPVPEPGSGSAIQRFNELRREVLKEKESEKVRRKGEERETVPTLAELTLPKEELRRLRTIGVELKKKLKVGKAGITEGIVNGIHERWRRTELVKIVCEDFLRMNMKRTHDLLERKTGGLVIWRSGSNIILYRGANYKYPYFSSDDNSNQTSATTSPDSGMDGLTSGGPKLLNTAQPPLIRGVGSPNRVRFQLPGEAQFAEEADRMLDGLGPRFTDWWGYDPLPVDADLLPAVVPGYRRPFRLLPYGVKPILTNDEMTVLKRLGRPLPCHFALGRNRKLQGLAASIVKLWEKCEIAKIAVKRGVQNTSSQLMAEELKWLTGGSLISRDKEFIVLYRGKDFLPAAVSSAIAARRKCVIDKEKHKTDYNSPVMTRQDHKLGTEDENHRINDRKLDLGSDQRKLRSSEAAIKRTSTKLDMALANKSRAEELLAELEKEEIPQQPEIDKEGITEEERYMLRKVGLRMKPFLLLGRRGVFDGTVENMHLHWKYRELVKIMCSARSIEEIHGIARALEAESGGILVAVERIGKGYAIIVYRGKNYKRPACLRPQTLLNKREAMKRSIEAQRRESLKLHVLKLSRNIDELKLQMAKDKEMKSVQSAKESKSQRIKEQEMKKMQFAEYKVSEIELETNYSSCSMSPCNEENVKARSLEEVEEEPLHITAQEPLSKSVLEETNAIMDMTGESEDAKSTMSHDNPRSTTPFVESTQCEIESSLHRAGEKGSNRMPSLAIRLSNKDRLLLRKQALKVKKRPVLAVGKSNIVAGVAKTIKAHFQKHPLAIVNIKGRAKGTSVQEVVSKLEQATGAVLVSQEPSKVILYRGWGAEKERGQTIEKNTTNIRGSSEGIGSVTHPGVSPELMSAIRLECGLPCQQQEHEVS